MKDDFSLVPGDINLIYGHNEKGKTYIVESIISMLFKTGSKSPWKLRKWDTGGKIVVTGLSETEVTFRKTGKKMEDLWPNGIGLPNDFSRLLVVRAAETFLIDNEDGVGRTILKDYLSGEGLLDKIVKEIPSTLQKAEINYPTISGNDTGELQSWRSLKDDRDRINNLLKKAEQSYSSENILSLQQQFDKAEADFELMKKAKFHHAWKVSQEIDSNRRKLQNLPSEEELSRLAENISVYEELEKEIARKSKVLEGFNSSQDDYRWVNTASTSYRDLVYAKNTNYKHSFKQSILLYLAMLSFLGTVVSGLLQSIPSLVTFAIMTLLLFFADYLKRRRPLESDGISVELQKIEGDFERRFGFELTNQPVLDAQAQKLHEEFTKAEVLQHELESELIPSLDKKSRDISVKLKDFTEVEHPREQWRASINSLREKIRILTGLRDSERDKLLSLAVKESEYIDWDPGSVWDSNQHGILEQNKSTRYEELQSELKNLENLKREIKTEIKSDSSDWGELINVLQEKREKTAREYKEKTAEILAKMKVFNVIQSLREEENNTIVNGLKNKLVIEPLNYLTSHYTGIRYDAGQGLILNTNDDEEYSLADISTGAREQVFLALRIGFASIKMEGQPAFLLLDDAFQHSDWLRRPNLVDHLFNLVENGWQVFYFTMDDHIRDLFLTKGKKIGEKFKYQELS